MTNCCYFNHLKFLSIKEHGPSILFSRDSISFLVEQADQYQSNEISIHCQRLLSHHPKGLYLVARWFTLVRLPRGLFQFLLSSS